MVWLLRRVSHTEAIAPTTAAIFPAVNTLWSDAVDDISLRVDILCKNGPKRQQQGRAGNNPDRSMLAPVMRPVDGRPPGP